MAIIQKWLFIPDSPMPTLKVDYYEDNKNTKSCFLMDIQIIEGIPTATKITMRNLLDNTETTMEYLNITYDIEFERSFFTERNLKQ